MNLFVQCSCLYTPLMARKEKQAPVGILLCRTKTMNFPAAPHILHFSSFENTSYWKWPYLHTRWYSWRVERNQQTSLQIRDWRKDLGIHNSYTKQFNHGKTGPGEHWYPAEERKQVHTKYISHLVELRAHPPSHFQRLNNALSEIFTFGCQMLKLKLRCSKNPPNCWHDFQI